MSVFGCLPRWGGLPLSVALATAGCSWLVPREGPPSPSSPDAGVPPSPLAITSLDGTGSERAVSEIPSGLSGAVPAQRRLREEIVVEGRGLANVTRASLAAADGSHAFEELEFQVEPPSAREGESAVYLRVTLPTGVRAGLYTLTLLAGAHEARAQVYLLQGEPGPPGPASLVRVVELPIGDANCPRGGAHILAGADRDGDGILDEGEVESASPACHGDPGLTCAEGACILASDLEVEGSVFVSGPGGQATPVVAQLSEPVTFSVGPGASYPTLQAALDALDSVRIARGAQVTLRLTAGSHTLTTPIQVRHPDGRRIRIVGANESDPSATVLLLSAETSQHGLVVQQADLGGFNGLTLRNVGARGGNGVLVDAGRVVLGPALVVEDFDIGISAYHGAEVFAHGTADTRVTVRGHLIGFFAQEASLHANYAAAVDPLPGAAGTTGFNASLGGKLFATQALATGNTIGMTASIASYVHAPGAVITGPGNTTDTKGFFAQYGASIAAPDSVVTNAMFGYHAIYNSNILVWAHGTLTNTPRHYCAMADSTVHTPTYPHQYC